MIGIGGSFEQPDLNEKKANESSQETMLSRTKKAVKKVAELVLEKGPKCSECGGASHLKSGRQSSKLGAVVVNQCDKCGFEWYK